MRAAAAHLNYSVNYAASALRSTVTNTIGLVIPTATDPFCAQLLDEIEPVIDVDSQQLLLGIGGDQATQIQRIESLMDRHVDGLIVLPPGEPTFPRNLNITPPHCRSCKWADANARSAHPW